MDGSSNGQALGRLHNNCLYEYAKIFMIMMISLHLLKETDSTKETTSSKTAVYSCIIFQGIKTRVI